jgi:hypothetical protein
MTGSIRPRGIVLVELLAAISAGMIAAALTADLLLDALYLQRAVIARADRAAIMADLIAQLDADALAATAATWDGTTLALDTLTPAGRQDVHYVIAADNVTRTAGEGESRLWQALRLEFAAEIERGPQGQVLRLDFTEQPGPRARVAGPHRWTRVFTLPLESEPDRGGEDE